MTSLAPHTPRDREGAPQENRDGSPNCAPDRGAAGDAAGQDAASREVDGSDPEPADADGWIGRGKARVEAGDADGAIAAYRRALELEPRRADAVAALGSLLAKHRPPETALAFYREAIATAATDAAAARFHCDRGALRQQLGDRGGAVDDYLAAVAVHPPLRTSYRKLRYAWFGGGDRDRLAKAVATYREATARDPENADAHNAWAYALTRLGRPQEAAERFRRAAYLQTRDRRPDFVHNHWHELHPRAPRFAIIGGGKCGTRSLYEYLMRHPQAIAPTEKEIDFFSKEYRQGLDWYRAHFAPLPPNGSWTTGEASPSYLTYPGTAERLQAAFPDLKLVVLLRNPVDRALSHYHHWRRSGRETRPFEAVLDEELPLLEPPLDADRLERYLVSRFDDWNTQAGYCLLGLYAYFLPRWLSRFPRERVLILISETLFAEPEATVTRVCDFLGLPPPPAGLRYKKQNAGDYDALPPAWRDRLTAAFEPHNRALADRLEQALPQSWWGEGAE